MKRPKTVNADTDRWVCVLLSEAIFLPSTYSQEGLAVNFDSTEPEQKCHVLYFPINRQRRERTGNEADLEFFSPWIRYAEKHSVGMGRKILGMLPLTAILITVNGNIQIWMLRHWLAKPETPKFKPAQHELTQLSAHPSQLIQ